MTKHQWQTVTIALTVSPIDEFSLLKCLALMALSY